MHKNNLFMLGIYALIHFGCEQDESSLKYILFAERETISSIQEQTATIHFECEHSTITYFVLEKSSDTLILDDYQVLEWFFTDLLAHYDPYLGRKFELPEYSCRLKSDFIYLPNPVLRVKLSGDIKPTMQGDTLFFDNAQPLVLDTIFMANDCELEPKVTNESPPLIGTSWRAIKVVDGTETYLPACEYNYVDLTFTNNMLEDYEIEEIKNSNGYPENLIRTFRYFSEGGGVTSCFYAYHLNENHIELILIQCPLAYIQPHETKSMGEFYGKVLYTIDGSEFYQEGNQLFITNTSTGAVLQLSAE